MVIIESLTVQLASVADRLYNRCAACAIRKCLFIFLNLSGYITHIAVVWCWNVCVGGMCSFHIAADHTWEQLNSILPESGASYPFLYYRTKYQLVWGSAVWSKNEFFVFLLNLKKLVWVSWQIILIFLCNSPISSTYCYFRSTVASVARPKDGFPASYPTEGRVPR